MRIEVDQSGRIEYTRKPTVLAFSNSNARSIIISASEKQYLQRIFRKAGKSRLLMFKTFAAMILILLKSKTKHTTEVVIDREYDGYDSLLMGVLNELNQKENFELDLTQICFKNIGKDSNAHRTAIESFRKNRADKRIYASDILKIVM